MPPTHEKIHAQLGLRDYQEGAIGEVEDTYKKESPNGHGAYRASVVAATGTGKTTIFTALALRFLERKPEAKVLVIAHRNELLTQAKNRIDTCVAGMDGFNATTGIIKGRKNQHDADILIASVQTASRANRLTALRNALAHNGDENLLIIVDECHHATAASYRKILDFFPEAKKVGFTATMMRAGKDDLSTVWDGVVYNYEMEDAIEEGYLCALSGRTVQLDDFDLSKVKMKGGDFAAADLAEALKESESAKTRVASEWVEHAGGRQTIIFCPSVQTGEDWTEFFNGYFSERGHHRAEMITGDTPVEDRTAIYGRYGSGETKFLVNCMVLTEGFDAPCAKCVIITRLTGSEGLYRQMVGRVLRPYEGQSALIIDVVGVSAKHSLCTSAVVFPDKEEKEKQEREERDKTEKRERIEKSLQHISDLPGMEELTFEDINLFEGQTCAWVMALRGTDGLWCLPCGTTTYFPWPSAVEGLWDVWAIEKTQAYETKFFQKRRDLSWTKAVELCSRIALGDASNLVRTTARWRKEDPTPGQIKFARTLGLDLSQYKTKGELSGAISGVLFVRSVTERQAQKRAERAQVKQVPGRQPPVRQAQSAKKKRGTTMGEQSVPDIREYDSAELRAYLEVPNRFHHPYEGVANAHEDDCIEILSWFDASRRQVSIFSDALKEASSPGEKEKYGKLHGEAVKAYEMLFEDFDDLHTRSVLRRNR